MGLAFSSIPGIGVISGWPDIGTFALVQKLYAIAYYRIWSVPEHRQIKAYIAVDVATGSSAGGGGAGTIASPYKVRHMADLRTLVAAILVTNMTIYLRRGDVFEASAANSAQGITLNIANTSLSSYEDPAARSAEKPVLTGFRTVSGGASGGSNLYTYSIGALRCYWVRARPNGTTQSNWFDQPYKKRSSAVTTGNPDFEWFDDAAGTVTTKVGTHDLATVQFAYATGAGITITDVDNVGVFRVASEGWGLDAPGTAGGGFCALSNCSGNNEHLWYGNRLLAGPYHVCGQILTGTGGITTWAYNQWGLYQWDGSQGGDANVAFASGGDHECVRIGNRCSHAGLLSEGIRDVRGTNPYSHSGGPGTPNRLLIDLDGDYSPTWGNHAGYTMSTTVGTPANNRLVSSYRMFIHNQRATLGSNADSDKSGIGPTSMNGVYTNSTITFQLAPPTDPFAEPFGAGATAAIRNCMVNCSIVINRTGNWTGKTLVPLYSTSDVHDFDWVHCDIRLTGNTGNGNAIIWQPGTMGQASSLWNCVTTNETGIAAGSTNLTGVGNYFLEADPAVSAGGFSGCAFFGYTLSEYSGTPGYKTLSAAATWTQRKDIPFALVNASLALPTGIKCEFDRQMRRRHIDPTRRTIGSLEARPTDDITRHQRERTGRERAIRA